MAFLTALGTVLGSHLATIIAGALVLGLAYIGLSPGGRNIIKGVRNYLTSNASNNPKIAAGIYDEKIKELTEKKRLAVELAEKSNGALVAMCQKQKESSEEFKLCSSKAKKLEERGEHDQALLLARQAQTAKKRMDDCALKIPDLQSMADATSKRVNEIEWKITDMKERKTLAIENIKKGKLEKEISEELMELDISDIDVTIQGIEEHSNEQKYMGIGARMAYENSDEKRVKDALQSADHVNAEEFLKQLMENNE